MIETTERFLREIADRIGLNAIDEVRLFPPLRQSGVETGVAVVAAIPLPPEPEHAHAPDEPPEALSEGRHHRHKIAVTREPPGGAKRRCSYESEQERRGVLVGGASRSKRLARVVVVCARGSQRVSELAAEEDTPPRPVQRCKRSASG